MSHLSPGLISAYNSLTDKHLAGYFSNTRIRRHLQRAGLITRSGRIVPDKEYRHKLIQRAHQRHVRECLAQAIFHKVLEMERLHQIEIKRKLEEFARRERVHKIKVDRSKRYEEEMIRILSPRPPTGARGIRKQHSGPEGEHSESSESPSLSRPNTAPGKMQRPVRLKPIHSNGNTASLRRSSPYRLHESSNENDQPFNCTMDKESRRRFTTMEASRGISPYCLPVINNFVTPVPPATKRKERGVKVTPSGTVRGRRLRPTTASSGADVNEEPPMLRSSVLQSRVCVNMVYFGKTVHLSHDLSDMRDEVKVFQQHCGGENLCVYKGKLREGEMFQFISRRHRGFPFSLTFFLNGLQVERLSSCCEFKHRKGSRLGGRHGHFGFSGIEGASPCYKCIIAMGLDKKPTPPPKRVKDDSGREETVSSPKNTAEIETEMERTVEDAGSHSECETSRPQDMETQVKEETAPEEDKLRDDYEEDFEADDEGPTEDAEAKERKSASPSRKTEKQVQERKASETEDDEKDDIKSHSGSSCSDSDQEESDTEAPKDSSENEKVEEPTEVREIRDQEETIAPSDEKDEPNPEEASATTAESAAAAAKDSDIQDSAGDSTEIDISDASIPSGNENKQSDDTSGDKEDEKIVDENKQEEEQERAKSVQEKLAEAILKESQCSSEPELSDTSTEEEEEATDKGHKQDNEDAIPEKSVVEAEMIEDHEEKPEPKVQKDETQQEPQESIENYQDEMVKQEEDVEKAASEEDKDEAAVEKDESEVTEDTDAALHPVSEEKMAEDDKASESQDDAVAKSAETEAADKDEENKQKTAEEAEMQPDEMGNRAKSSTEDESSVSELDKKTDETEVPDNAEAEAMTAVSETMEIKAEPSEEREALSCEEAPVTNTERQQEGSTDRTAGSETEVTVDNSSSSSEGSGDTTVHAKTADTSVDNVKEESSKDDVKEEEAEAEEASGADASKDDSEKQVRGAGEDIEESVEINDKAEEEKSEEESKEEEKQTTPEEIPEGERTEEREKDETDKTEEENDESTAEETIENTENSTEGTKTESNTEGKSNEEQSEKTMSEEDKVANDEKADESEKQENDEDDSNNVDSECARSKDGEEESEGKEATADKTNEGEDINETNANEEKGDQAEETEKDENGNAAGECEVVNKDEEEPEEKKIITDSDKTVEGEEVSEITEEPEKSLEEDLDKDNVKISDENVVESEVVGYSEAEDANRSKTTEEILDNMTGAENVVEEAQKESESGEGGEVGVGNGEKSTKAESNTNEDEAEALTEDKNIHTDIKDNETEEIKEDLDDKDSDSKDNTQNQVSEVIVASSGDGAQSSTPVAIDLESTDNKENESDSNTDKQPHTDENAAADLSAADGENGRADTEEASKASEEGASVLLKPQVQSTELTQGDADNAEENTVIGKETPETLAKEDNTDLVTNWVTMHQTSKYFEKFVEPLEDLRGSDAQTSNSNTEATQSTELLRSVSPVKIMTMSDGEAADGDENAEERNTQKDVNEAGDETKVEAVQSDLKDNESEDDEPGKDTLHVEETEVKNLTPNTPEQNVQDSGTELSREDMKSEECKGSKGSLEGDKIQDGPAQRNPEETDISKTEVESIAGTDNSGASDKPESVTVNQTEEKMTENEKQTTPEERKDLLSSLKTEEHQQHSESPELTSADTTDEQKSAEAMQEKTDEESREVTEITDLTTAKSDDGSQEETEPKLSDGSINGDRRGVQLIQDIKHTLSKDRLSMFSVDETLFGCSSHPLLTAARTESGH